MNNNKVIYRLKIEDVQNVALEEYGRKLTDEELEKVEENLGDYIKWYDL
jgi:predicted transcriptional regulator